MYKSLRGRTQRRNEVGLCGDRTFDRGNEFGRAGEIVDVSTIVTGADVARYGFRKWTVWGLPLVSSHPPSGAVNWRGMSGWAG